MASTYKVVDDESAPGTGNRLKRPVPAGEAGDKRFLAVAPAGGKRHKMGNHKFPADRACLRQENHLWRWCSGKLLGVLLSLAPLSLVLCQAPLLSYLLPDAPMHNARSRRALCKAFKLFPGPGRKGRRLHIDREWNVEVSNDVGLAHIDVRAVLDFRDNTPGNIQGDGKRRHLCYDAV